MKILQKCKVFFPLSATELSLQSSQNKASPYLLKYNLIFACRTSHLVTLFGNLYMNSTYYSKSLGRNTRTQASTKQFFVINQELKKDYAEFGAGEYSCQVLHSISCFFSLSQ